MNKDFKYNLVKRCVEHRKKMFRLPALIIILYFTLPMLNEVLRFNFFFFREWIETNKFYTGYMIQMFVGPHQLYLWLHFIVIGLMVVIALSLIKKGIWNRVFPMLIFKDAHSYRQERRVYWYTGCWFEEKYRKFLNKYGEELNIEDNCIIINTSMLLSFVNPYKNMVKIKIPDLDVILERRTDALVVQDTGVLHKHKEDEWELTWEHNQFNEVDSEQIIKEVSRLLSVQTDETSKAAKSDPAIRKKVIMDATFTQASFIQRDLKELINEIREGDKDE